MKLRRMPVFILLAAFMLGILCFPVTANAQDNFPPDDAAAAGLGCACIVVILVINLALLVLWIVICVYVYRDAKARGMENAVLWLILVIITGFIGLIIYLIVRPPKPEQ